MSPVSGPHDFPNRNVYDVAAVVAEAERFYTEAIRTASEVVTRSIMEDPATGLWFLSKAIEEAGQRRGGPAYVVFTLGPEKPPRSPEYSRARWSEKTMGPVTLPSSGEDTPRSSFEIERFLDPESGDNLRRWTYDAFVTAWNNESRAVERYGPTEERAGANRRRLRSAFAAARHDDDRDAERDCVGRLAALIVADMSLRVSTAPGEISTKDRAGADAARAQLITDVVALAVKSELDAGTLIVEEDFAGERTRGRGGAEEPMLTWTAFYEFARVFTEAECGVGHPEAIERALRSTGVLEEDDFRPATDRIKATVEKLVKHAEEWAAPPYGYGPPPVWAPERKTRRPR